MPLTPEMVRCPYCGEYFETVLDLSAGSQTYFEDCYVCCRPIAFRLGVDAAGTSYQLVLLREDE